MIAKIQALSPTGWTVAFETKPMELEALLEALPGIETRLEEAGFDAVASQPPAPVTVTVNPTPAGNSFAARELVCEILDKKPYWKILGAPPYHKFGMRVWPETLEAAGIDVDKVNVMEGLALAGYTAHWEYRDNKAKGGQTKVEVALTKWPAEAGK